MPSISVCIVTFRRPFWLKRLLKALASLEQPGSIAYRMSIVVVDNDAKASARLIANEFARNASLNLNYVVEPRQGIPIARNAALAAVPADADFICFLDDDEWPSPQWLNELLKIQQTTGAPCLYGPVEPRFPGNAPDWIVRSGIFSCQQHNDGAELSLAATNNVMFSAQFVREHGLRFDERLRFSGGEDQLFFHQAVQRGLRICWARNALVYEEIPENRLALSWILQRQYRVGNSYSLCDRIAGSPVDLIRRFFVAFARIGLGISIMPLAIFGKEKVLWSLRHIVRGIGMLGGLFGHQIEVYRPDQVTKDRHHG